jgi:uncharacterized protein
MVVKKKPTMNAEDRAIMEMILNTAMTTRTDLFNKLLDPRRDINAECGYPVTISNEQYRAMYDRELGRRVVDIYPEETWEKSPDIYEDENLNVETEFEKVFNALEDEHSLLHYMQRADALSGVGHYGTILWGIDDGLDLNQPVAGFETWKATTGKPSTGTPKKRNLTYIRVLDESLATVGTYNNDPKSPRYGQPETYTITLADPSLSSISGVAAQPGGTQTTVHWTRVTHIADNRKTSEVFGSPRMEPVWNRLYDLVKVLGGAGEMFWKGGNPGISLETQPGLENARLDADATETAMYKYMNGLQKYIALTGMSAKSLAPNITDPMSFFKTQVEAICVTIGVPFRVFMGIEEGVVSGSQATNAWNRRLDNRKNRYVTPMLIKPVLQRLTDLGVLPPIAVPYGWKIVWPDISNPSVMEKAEVAIKRTDALVKYVSGGVDSVMAPLEFLTLICGFNDSEAKSIIEAVKQHIDDVDDDETVPGHFHPKEPLETPPTPSETPGNDAGRDGDGKDRNAE